MNSPIHKSLLQSADKVFPVLGQTLYMCQLLETTMLEVIATTTNCSGVSIATLLKDA